MENGDKSLLRNVQTDCGSHRSYSSIYREGPFPVGDMEHIVKLLAYMDLEPKVRISGAIPLSKNITYGMLSLSTWPTSYLLRQHYTLCNGNASDIYL